MKKKAIAIILIVMLLFSFSACSDNSVENSKEITINTNYLSNIINVSDEYYEYCFGYDNPFRIDKRHFNVVKEEGNKQTIFYLDINGVSQTVIVKDTDFNKDRFIFKDPKPYSAKIVDDARSKTIDFVNNTAFFKNKGDIIKKLQEIQVFTVKLEEFDDMGVYRDRKIYLSNEHINEVNEFYIAHEFVHALADITNGGVEKNIFAYNLFNEALTDIITLSFCGNATSNAISAYYPYYEFMYPYVSIFKEDAIKAYFYGYDELLQKISRDELELFVQSLANYDDDMGFLILNNLIYKWEYLVNE